LRRIQENEFCPHPQRASRIPSRETNKERVNVEPPTDRLCGLGFMKRGEHQIRVTVEIVSDGLTIRIPSELQTIPPLMPLHRAAKFMLQNCLESKALRDWNGPASEYPHRGD